MKTSTSISESSKPGAAAAVERFTSLQRKLLDFYGVRATSRFVSLRKPAMRAHVLDAGEGHPVVILHGGDGEAVNWAPIMKPLQDHVRIYAVDRPGFGLSDAFDYRTVDLREHAADFIASLFDALGLPSAILIGGSMGGFFAISAALAHPERVPGLVLAGYPAGATRELSEPMRILCGTPGAPEQFMATRDSLEAQHAQYRDMFHVDLQTIPELYFETRIAGLRLPSEQGTWATLLPRLGTLEGLRDEVYLGDELPNLMMPVLGLWGDHDMAPVEVGRELTAVMPRGRFAHIPGIGHFPFLEAPEQSAQLIAEFVSSIAG